MSIKSELVSDFRETIDAVIQLQETLARSRRTSYPGMSEHATVSGLLWESIPRRAGAPGRAPEHRWGVSGLGVVIGKHAGSLAIESTAGDEEFLRRRFSLDNRSNSTFRVDTTLELHDEDSLRLAVDWVRAPHLQILNVLRLVELSDEEREYINTESEQINRENAALSRDLDSLARSRAMPAPEPGRRIGDNS